MVDERILKIVAGLVERSAELIEKLARTDARTDARGRKSDLGLTFQIAQLTSPPDLQLSHQAIKNNEIL